MKFSDIKLNIKLISPCGGLWKVIRKYASDMWLIKQSKTVCILTGGQVRRGWKLRS